MDETTQSGPGPNTMNNNNNINNTGGNLVTNKVGDDLNAAVVNNVAQYTIPGVLHFIQHEWTRFELERSQWDVDRAELQARIAVLVGERKGQESLKSDLIRRIKMLEFALKQERIKFHRLRYGCEPPNITADMKTDEGNIASELAPDSDEPFSTISNITWRQGRQLLRQYLQEVGYTDAIIDVRSNRVRSLLGLNREENQENLDENVETKFKKMDKLISDTYEKRLYEHQQEEGANRLRAFLGLHHHITKNHKHPDEQKALLLETEAAVLANFEFLAQADSEIPDDDDLNDGLELPDMVGLKESSDKHKGTDDVDAEANDVLNELNLLTDGEKASLSENRNNDGDWVKDPRHLIPGMGTTEDDVIDQNLGELAQLTVNNEAETTYDDLNSKEPYRKTWTGKYTLRSHFDCVRALAFHPTESVLITGSEDHTLKLWNLQKTVPAKKSTNLDVEPLYTFRGHISPVLCVAINSTGEQCYSGSLDGVINCWNLPNSNIDPYDNYDAEIFRGALEGHSDSVWELSAHNTKGSLLSASADATIKLWSPLDKTPLLQTFVSDDTKDNNPTSVDFIHDDLDKIVAAYQSSNCVIYDTETCKSVLRFQAQQDAEIKPNIFKYVYKVISHPTLPIIITAHEDRYIRFWDSKNGYLIRAMVAHLEAVTSLAIDSHGLYLLSGSHDCSIRLWNIDSKMCIQEITAHRKKFDESILNVAFHPSKPYIASAGADAIAKVFV